MATGWDNGLNQDYDKKLAKWFSTRLGARYQLEITMNQETLDSTIARTIQRANPPLIMSLEDIANILGMSYNYVKNVVQYQPDFPPKLDRFKQPRWSRDTILTWAQVV